jgi:hypothetical protein
MDCWQICHNVFWHFQDLPISTAESIQLDTMNDHALIHHDQALLRIFLLIRTFSILDPSPAASALQRVSATAAKISSADLALSQLCR